MNPPDPQQLHVALAHSFAAAHTRQQVGALVEILDADLRRPAYERDADPTPRVVVFLALWQIVERELSTAAGWPSDRLKRLVRDALGCTLGEIGQWRALRVDGWRVVARQFGILDYVWTAQRPGADGAELSVLVQLPVHELEWMLEPSQWAARCPLFWADITAIQSRSSRTRFAAVFKPPTSSLGATLPVDVTIERIKTTLGFEATLEIASANAGSSLRCMGFLSAEKEQGRPWTTRITHRKCLSGGTYPSELLAYWTQAETLCLALGGAAMRQRAVS